MAAVPTDDAERGHYDAPHLSHRAVANVLPLLLARAGSEGALAASAGWAHHAERAESLVEQAVHGLGGEEDAEAEAGNDFRRQALAAVERAGGRAMYQHIPGERWVTRCGRPGVRRSAASSLQRGAEAHHLS
jgi:hypothetical protein